jgi:ribosome-binding protein aMBF1 (putative translation factor)
MTNIEKIKQARQDLDCLLMELGERAEFRKRISKLQFEALKVLLQDFAYAQAEALRQATEVADENFARAQKLSEQVQENVRHIERLAERRSDEDQRIARAIEATVTVLNLWSVYPDRINRDEINGLGDKLTIALALAKGEAV